MKLMRFLRISVGIPPGDEPDRVASPEKKNPRQAARVVSSFEIRRDCLAHL
jgi:hypothetical protein